MNRRPAVALGLLSLLVALISVLTPLGADAAKPRPPSPTVSVGDVTVTETDAAGVVATFTVTLTKGTGKKVKVDWATQDGTATGGTDYAVASGRLVFSGPAKKQTRQVTVTVSGDDLVEPDETFTLALTKASGGKAKRAKSTATIRNDDTAATAPPVKHALTVATAGTGGGGVTSLPAGISCGADCSEQYAAGTSVTLTAAPDGLSTFAGWSGGCTGTSPACVVTMGGATSVTATFARRQVTLTVAKDGTGAGTVASTPAGIDCGADCTETYPAGTSVTLAPTATSGSRFAGWSGACTGAGTCVVELTAAATVTATFADLPDHTLTVATAGAGSGSVTSDPAGITCPTTCTHDYEEGVSVVLTATPDGQSTFTGWTGACSGTSSTCEVAVAAAASVTATFAKRTFLLMAVPNSGSGGTVTSDPGGITCGSHCGESFEAGTVVTLTATPASGYQFAGWSGGGCTGTGTCAVTMTADTTIDVTFVLLRSLQLSVTGVGTGSVTSDPAGLSCTSSCSADYPDGTSVTLTATPGYGQRFVGWSGSGCSGTGTCTVSMSQPRSVQATFGLATFAVTVVKDGTGSGTVLSDTQNGKSINCGNTCTVSFDYGSQVNLGFTANVGNHLAGWAGGGCSGAAGCRVTITGPITVTATFDLDDTKLLVVLNGAAQHGRVTSPQAGTCGPGVPSCETHHLFNTVVQLTAVADPGYHVSGWLFCPAPSGNTCTVTMSGDQSVTAQFAAD